MNLTTSTYSRYLDTIGKPALYYEGWFSLLLSLISVVITLNWVNFPIPDRWRYDICKGNEVSF